jgi:hypothetical protein
LLLDTAEWILYNELMARFYKLIREMQRQLSADGATMNGINEEREKLRSAHQRFLELEDIATPKQERIDITAAMLLGGVKEVERAKRGEYPFDEDFDPSQAVTIPISINTLDRLDPKGFPLWKIIREIVRHSPGIQVVKLQRALAQFGIDVPRQSIESSLSVHKRDFRIVWRGREKFVSLK